METESDNFKPGLDKVEGRSKKGKVKKTSGSLELEDLRYFKST
jgi:hypothetical protein